MQESIKTTKGALLQVSLISNRVVLNFDGFLVTLVPTEVEFLVESLQEALAEATLDDYSRERCEHSYEDANT
jgi:hypothetical protein